MTVVALWSAKGSPGVTTTVAALAAVWPEDRPLLVVEADPAGGDLVVWLDHPAEPSTVSLAAAGRRGIDQQLIDAHTQPLRPSDAGTARQALLGPVGAEQSAAALQVLRARFLDAVGSAHRDVLIDCGRMDPSSPVSSLLPVVDRTLAVCRPRVADAHHLAARVSSLHLRDVGELVLVGDQPYDVEEVALTVGLRPFGSVAVDAKAAATLAGDHPAGARLLRRSHLLRSARLVAEALVRDRPPLLPVPPSVPPDAATAPAPEGS